MNVRALAARTLVPVLRQKSSLDSAFNNFSERVDEKDQGFYRELCFGVCRYFYSLEEILSQLIHKPVKPKDTDVKALMLVGLYQLSFMRVPDHAAINETVNGAKVLKKLWSKNLVNAVLRGFLRDKDQFLKRLQEHHNHPEWLVTKIRSAWPELANEITTNNNAQAPLTLRINQRRMTRDAYETKLRAQDILFRECEFSANGLTLETATDVANLPGFSAGDCSVQDEAAQLSAQLLDLKEGHRVLDACCAPGGKTGHILETQPDLDELVAVDLEQHRLNRVTENLSRLNLSATLIAADATKLDTWWNKKIFDRVLLDAPCSATGVIRRHPDIKLLRREEDIAALTALQYQILETLWVTLRSGGLLIYATCSLLPEENENVVQRFVEQRTDAIHLPLEADWGETRPYGRQLFPQKDGHDGFYYARIKKG